MRDWLGLPDVIDATQRTGALPAITLISVSIASVQPMERASSPVVAAALPDVRHRVRMVLSPPAVPSGAPAA